MQKSRQAVLKYLSDNNLTLEECKSVLQSPEVRKELTTYLPNGFYERLVAGVETLQQETYVQDVSIVDVSLPSISRVRLLPLSK